MNSRRWWVLLVLAAVVACSGGTAETVESTLASTTSAPLATTLPHPDTSTSAGFDRVAAWEEDIDLLGQRIRLLHPNPFWRADESEFDTDLAVLKDSVPDMSDDEIVLELVKLVARIDGHTHLSTGQEAVGFGRYQIRFYEFTDGVFVVESTQPDLVGGELISVDGVSVDQVLEKVSPYAQWDNPQTIKNLRTLFLVTPAVLIGEGLIEDGDRPSFEIERPDGSVVVVDPPVLPSTRWNEWAEHPVLPPARASVDIEGRFDNNIWWKPLDDSTVYIQYNMVTPLGSIVPELEEHLGSSKVEKVIVDLRRNPGGNNTTFGELRELLVEADEMGIQIVMLTSRQTFSAAANFSTYIDLETEAIFVGEGMGGSPNLYGDTRPLTLPNSGIIVDVSGRYWEIGGPDDTRDTIEPDIEVGVASSDYFQGRDPVLDAALGI